MTRRGRGPESMVVVAVAVAMGLLTPGEASTETTGSLEGAARVVQNLVPATGRAPRGAPPTPQEPFVIGTVARPVPFRAPARRPTTACDPDLGPAGPCDVSLAARKGFHWAILGPRFPRLRWADEATVLDQVGGPLPPLPTRVLDAKAKATVRMPAYAARKVLAYPARPLRRLGLQSEPFRASPHHRLRFSTAVEPIAWPVDSAPTDFVVTVHAPGAEPVEVFRSSLDPSRRPEDRGWRDHDVSLEPFRGERIVVRLETMPTERGDPRPQLPLWGDPKIVSASASRGSRPFVVLVSLDTLRARSLSALGNDLETSPFFDALATQGTLFERAFTTFSNTLGSHMSMLTGLWPRSHLVRGHRALARDEPTLAERLRANGYETAAFTENALLNGRQGFWRGFGLYSENRDVKAGAGASRETFDEALGWARDHRDVPFFLFVHTYEVHAPYAPKEPYASMFASDAHRNRNGRRYEQEIRYLDDQLRRLVSGLDEILGAENLLLVVTADHGEEFGEHGGLLHGQVFDEVMHVPLLLRWPGRVPADRRIAEPVSLVDVTPTILELTGTPASTIRDGASLVPLLDPSHAAAPRIVFAEAPPSLQNRERGQIAARNSTHKCILTWDGDGGRCFDVAADPAERSPLKPDHDDETRALHDAALEYRRNASLPLGEPAPPATQKEEIDPKRREKLRALGYVE